MDARISVKSIRWLLGDYDHVMSSILAVVQLSPIVPYSKSVAPNSTSVVPNSKSVEPHQLWPIEKFQYQFQCLNSTVRTTLVHMSLKPMRIKHSEDKFLPHSYVNQPSLVKKCILLNHEILFHECNTTATYYLKTKFKCCVVS